MHIADFINNVKIDFWTLWGLSAQGFFFMRLVIQWFYSERAKKTIIPNSFWLFGLIGSIMIFVYAFVRKDLVFLLTGTLQVLIYSRNLMIANKQKTEDKNSSLIV